MNWTNRENEPKKITIAELKLAVQNLHSALGEVDFKAAEKNQIEDALMIIGRKINSGYNAATIREALESIDKALEAAAKNLKQEHQSTSTFPKKQLAEDIASIMEGYDRDEKFIPRGGSPAEKKLSKVSQNLLEPELKYAAFKMEYNILKNSLNKFEEQSREKG